MAIMKRRKDQCIIDPGETKFVGVGGVEEVSWKGGQAMRAECFLWFHYMHLYIHIYVFKYIDFV